MKPQIFVAISCLSFYAHAAADNTLLTSCLSDKPPAKLEPQCDEIIKNAASTQALADTNAKAIDALTQKKAEADFAKVLAETAKIESDAKAAQTTAAATSLKVLADSIKPTPPTPIELNAFTSASQRFQSDLAFTVGTKIGQELIKAVIDNKVSKGRILLTSTPDTARQWIRTEDPDHVINDLTTQNSKIEAALMELAICMPPKVEKTKPSPKPGINIKSMDFGSVPVLVAGLELVINMARSIGNAFQPKLTDAAAITAPTGIVEAVMSGIFSAKYKTKDALSQKLTFTIQPPVINSDNKVLMAGKNSTEVATNAVKKLEDFKYKVKETDQKQADSCIANATTTFSSVKDAITAISTSNDPVLGSRLDQAARAVAASSSTSGIAGVALLSPITSGGAVATYKPRWPMGPRLVAAADYSLAFRIQDQNTGSIVFSAYESISCGRTLPVGDFSTGYRQADCVPIVSVQRPHPFLSLFKHRP